LRIEYFDCEAARCDVVYDNALRVFDTKVIGSSGEFLHVTDREFSSLARYESAQTLSLVAKLPRAILFWTYASQPGKGDSDRAPLIDALTGAVNHQRYEQALSDNVTFGRWTPQIHEYARTLLKEGRKPEAVAVLKQVLTASPFNYQAHADLMESTSDSAEA